MGCQTAKRSGNHLSREQLLHLIRFYPQRAQKAAEICWLNSQVMLSWLKSFALCRL